MTGGVDRSGSALDRLDGSRYGDPEDHRPAHVAPPDVEEPSTTIALVGCGSAKADEARPARDLYTSTYFDLKRRYAEQEADEWAILSAEHGLLDPDEEIDPYDTTIEDVNLTQWTLSIRTQLGGWIGVLDAEEIEIVALAGRDYLDPIRWILKDLAESVREPFAETSGIGEQMGLLSDRLEEGSA